MRLRCYDRRPGWINTSYRGHVRIRKKSYCKELVKLVQFWKGVETSMLERQRGGWRVFKTIEATINFFLFKKDE